MKQPSQIFLEAAESVARGFQHLACRAVLVGAGSTEAHNLFVGLFDPQDGRCIWFDDPADPINRSARVLALLFAHEFAKDIGR